MKLILLPLLVTACLADDAPLKFVSLSDGKSLAGWHGDGHLAEGGEIICTLEGRNLVSHSTYTNYVFDFEFKLPPGGNNGLGIHYPGAGDPAYTGMELQILDDSAEKWKDSKPEQFHGSLYGLAAAKRGALKPPGEWNLQRVIVSGKQVKVDLNGTVILDADLDALQEKFPDHAGLKRRAGHLALCGHGDRVSFRKPRIAEMPPSANVEAVKAAGFTQLFNGRDLDGWQIEEAAAAHWVPINGILKYDGRSQAEVKDLWTEREFGDFTLVFDWRWSSGGPPMMRPLIGPNGEETGESVEVAEHDSGVYLRGDSKAQVNLWNWPAGSGELYGYRTDPAQPAEVRTAVTPKMKADRPVGEWNRMMITMKGEVLSVVLNGVTVIDEAALPGVKPAGRIGLQHHGSAIDFANVWIKEL